MTGDVVAVNVKSFSRPCLVKAAELLAMTSYLGPDGSWSCVEMCEPCALRLSHVLVLSHFVPPLANSGVSYDSRESHVPSGPGSPDLHTHGWDEPRMAPDRGGPAGPARHVTTPNAVECVISRTDGDASNVESSIKSIQEQYVPIVSLTLTMKYTITLVALLNSGPEH
jgi:hypothetical protein